MHMYVYAYLYSYVSQSVYTHTYAVLFLSRAYIIQAEKETELHACSYCYTYRVIKNTDIAYHCLVTSSQYLSSVVHICPCAYQYETWHLTLAIPVAVDAVVFGNASSSRLEVMKSITQILRFFKATSR